MSVEIFKKETVYFKLIMILFLTRRNTMKKVMLSMLYVLVFCSFGFATTFDFESGDLTGWTIRAEHDSDWSIKDDSTNPGNNKVLDYSNDSSSGDILRTGEGTYTDGSIVWDMYYNSHTQFKWNRVYIRAEDPGAGKTEVENGYYWRPEQRQLRKLVNGSVTTLASGSTLSLANSWHRFKAEAIGNTITIYEWDDINSKWNIVISATDNTFSSGYFGFRGSSRGTSSNFTYFDNVTIVPEPATIGLIAMGFVSLLRKK